jgi:hypothetical protein
MAPDIVSGDLRHAAMPPAALSPWSQVSAVLRSGDRLIDNTAHDAGIGDLGVAQFAGFADVAIVFETEIFGRWNGRVPCASDAALVVTACRGRGG